MFFRIEQPEMRESDSVMKTTDGMLCMKSDYVQERAQEQVGVGKEGVMEIWEDNAWPGLVKYSLPQPLFHEETEPRGLNELTLSSELPLLWQASGTTHPPRICVTQYSLLGVSIHQPDGQTHN